mgnify:CR=1 FL=1
MGEGVYLLECDCLDEGVVVVPVVVGVVVVLVVVGVVVVLVDVQVLGVVVVVGVVVVDVVVVGVVGVEVVVDVDVVGVVVVGVVVSMFMFVWLLWFFFVCAYLCVCLCVGTIVECVFWSGCMGRRECAWDEGERVELGTGRDLSLG